MWLWNVYSAPCIYYCTAYISATQCSGVRWITNWNIFGCIFILYLYVYQCISVQRSAVVWGGSLINMFWRSAPLTAHSLVGDAINIIITHHHTHHHHTNHHHHTQTNHHHTHTNHLHTHLTKIIRTKMINTLKWAVLLIFANARINHNQSERLGHLWLYKSLIQLSKNLILSPDQKGTLPNFFAKPHFRFSTGTCGQKWANTAQKGPKCPLGPKLTHRARKPI